MNLLSKRGAGNHSSLPDEVPVSSSPAPRILRLPEPESPEIDAAVDELWSLLKMDQPVLTLHAEES
jgi:hypothetical protein